MKTYKVEVTETVTKWYNESNQLHRENGPAVKYEDGGKAYYINGKLHREDGPAVEWADGDKSYFINDKLHREDGPAIKYANGSKFYFINGKLHREDGPAVKYVIGSVGFENGDKLYYINGKYLTKKQFRACYGKTVIVDGKDFTINIGKPKGRYVVPCFAVEQTEEAKNKILNGKEYDSLGGWTSKTGTYHLSANYHFISLSMALKWAKIKNQEAIFDLETRETIYL